MTEILQFIEGFFDRFIGILGQSLPPDAVQGIVALLCIGVIIRLVDVGAKVAVIPKKALERAMGRDEDEDEYVLVRRKK